MASEKLSQLYLALVQFGVPEREAEQFITELPKDSWFARRRRKQFLRKYRGIITAGAQTFGDNQTWRLSQS